MCLLFVAVVIALCLYKQCVADTCQSIADLAWVNFAVHLFVDATTKMHCFTNETWQLIRNWNPLFWLFRMKAKQGSKTIRTTRHKRRDALINYYYYCWKCCVNTYISCLSHINGPRLQITFVSHQHHWNFFRIFDSLNLLTISSYCVNETKYIN